LILSSNEAIDSSSGVHAGDGDTDEAVFLTDMLAMGSSRRSAGGTCGLDMGAITTEAGGVGSWMGLKDGDVCDSGRAESATALGSQDEMDGRRVLEAARVGGGTKRFMGLSVATSTDEGDES
jgi:hypothetical protein